MHGPSWARSGAGACGKGVFDGHSQAVWKNGHVVPPNRLRRDRLPHRVLRRVFSRAEQCGGRLDDDGEVSAGLPGLACVRGGWQNAGRVYSLEPYQPRYANAQPTKAYSCYVTNTVLRHCRWMRDYGIDGAVLQRFTKDVFIDATWAALKNTNLVNLKLGAEIYGRVFFLMYDISNDDPATVIGPLQSDWAYVTGTWHMTNSPRYLEHRGKPLIGIWGLGFSGGLAVSSSDAQSIIDFFKSAGCTVAGGVPAYWRTLNGDSQTNSAWAAVYRSFDVLSPWTIGRYSNESGANTYRTGTLDADLAECQSNHIDYLPVAFPGYSPHNLNGGYTNSPLNQIPRNGGGFFWRQIYNALSAGCTMLYGAMFDEIDEGTALYKLVP